MAFSQSMIEQIAAWCFQSPALAEERRKAWEEYFAESDPRPVQYWKGAEGQNSRERRFLGYFMFDYSLADGEKPAAAAIRHLYDGSAQAEALRAVAGARFVLAVVKSIIRRSVYLEVADESFEVRHSQWAASLHPGLSVVAHLVPVRQGHWLLGPGWIVWPFTFGPGIQANLKSYQLSPLQVERLIQGRRESEAGEVERPAPPQDSSLAAAVARMTAWAREHGHARLVMPIDEWQVLVVGYMPRLEYIRFVEGLVERMGGIESEEELSQLTELARNIWNNTPQPDRGGLTPNQLSGRLKRKGRP